MEAGEPDSARELLVRGIGLAEETGLGFMLPELYRLLAECLLLQAPNEEQEEARRLLETSLAIARERRMKALELRAACTLVSATKDAAVARDLLQPLCDSLPEGRHTADLAKAQQLLADILA